MHRTLSVVRPLTLVRPAALAAALLLAGASAQAQSTVSVYGLLDVAAGQFQVAGGQKIKRLDSGNFSTSYLGFRGSEDLGGGLRANFTLESFLLVDAGTAGRVNNVDGFWGRNANVGLSGGFGSLRFGRMGPPLFVSSLLFNSFGDSFGYSPTIRQYYSAPYGTPLVGDSGWNNSIGYSTPRFGGLTANVQVAAGEGAANARGPNWGANLVYFGGPVGLTFAAQKVEAQGTLGRPISAFPGFRSQSAYQLGGSFNAGFARFFAQYGSIDTKANAGVKVKNLHLSASVPVGPQGAFLAAYGSSSIKTAGAAIEPESDMLTLGYTHKLSKRTELYGIYLSDKYTGRSTGTTLATGMRHTF
jgi:predicted porin